MSSESPSDAMKRDAEYFERRRKVIDLNAQAEALPNMLDMPDYLWEAYKDQWATFMANPSPDVYLQLYLRGSNEKIWGMASYKYFADLPTEEHRQRFWYAGVNHKNAIEEIYGNG